MALIFVTGATGKVGHHVVSGLLERNEEVRALRGLSTNCISARAHAVTRANPWDM
jgi:nucleoside-diphosphate-sugar epimerase